MGDAARPPIAGRGRMRVSLTVKFALSIVLVTALAATAGVFGLRAAGDLRRGMQRLHERDVQGLVALERVHSDALRIRELALLHTLAAGVAGMTVLENQIRDLDGDLVRRLDVLQGTWTGEAKSELLDRVRAALTEYRQARDEVTIALSRAGRKEAARAAARGRVGRLFHRAEGLLEDLVALNRTSSGQRLRQGRDTYAAARTKIVAATGAAVLAGLLLAVLGAAVFGRNLRRLSAATRALAGGDLGVRAEVRSRDEVGALAEAFNGMATQIEARERERTAVADLASLALGAPGISVVLAEAARLAADALRADCAGVLELLPGGEALVLRAGVGWSPEAVGSASVATGSATEAGRALLSRAPIVVADRREESGFGSCPLLDDHELVSSVSAEIGGQQVPYGVLAAYARRPGAFVGDAGRFLRAVADVVATALERARAEAELRASRERYRKVVENSRELIGVCDPAGRQTYASPAYRAVLGHEPDDLVGEPALSLVHPDDAAEAERALAAAVRGEDASVALRLRRSEGEWLDVEGTLTPILDDAGAVEAVLGVARDVSQRRSLEEQLRQTQKMEAIGRLAGGIAHDFNNLLTGLGGFNALLLGELADDDPRRSYAQEVAVAAERAAGLTRQLLAFSRRQVLEPRVIDLNQVVAGMESLLRRVLGEDIDILGVLQPGLWRARIDRSQLEQVLLNLAVNARDAMPGGGRLTIETLNIELDAQYASGHAEVAPGRYVLLAITDTGIGMDAATRERAFEPFFTTKAAGTGLGLATVHGIVKQLGGHVWVYSEQGKGTTFKLYFPATDETADTESAPFEAATLSGTETVFVVEDEDVVRRLVVETLARRGYTVLEAAAPEEALRLSGSHEGEIQLLVTDVVLPGMNGRALAERIKAERPGVRVIYMSGYTENAIVHQGVLDADTAFIQKPFSLDALARKVREVLHPEGEA
jgi:PAS domain S-box-containing protein